MQGHLLSFLERFHFHLRIRNQIPLYYRTITPIKSLQLQGLQTHSRELILKLLNNNNSYSITWKVRSVTIWVDFNSHNIRHNVSSSNSRSSNNNSINNTWHRRTPEVQTQAVYVVQMKTAMVLAVAVVNQATNLAYPPTHTLVYHRFHRIFLMLPPYIHSNKLNLRSFQFLVLLLECSYSVIGNFHHNNKHRHSHSNSNSNNNNNNNSSNRCLSNHNLHKSISCHRIHQANRSNNINCRTINRITHLRDLIRMHRQICAWLTHLLHLLHSLW